MKEIGGYFELELPEPDFSQIPKGMMVNSGRHALEYILRTLGSNVRRVWLPYYTCDVVLQPIKRLSLDFKFYHINEHLEISAPPILTEGDCIIINNYFGIKDRYIEDMVKRYGDRLIVDNAQAWYCLPFPGANYIYSPRKFFGLPDGGIAICVKNIDLKLPRGTSFQRFSHLLKRIDLGAAAGYTDFKINSNQLSEESLTLMSPLTTALLGSLDYDAIREKRLKNFDFLNKNLKSINKQHIPDLNDFSCPMVYPFWTDDYRLKNILINNKIYVAQYWPNVTEWTNLNSQEARLASNIIPLPVDQRNGTEELIKIINIIKNENR